MTPAEYQQQQQKRREDWKEACTCYPGGVSASNYEGPQPWCDQHGSPSVAWDQGMREGIASIEPLHKLAIEQARCDGWQAACAEAEHIARALAEKSGQPDEVYAATQAGAYEHIANLIRSLNDKEQ